MIRAGIGGQLGIRIAIAIRAFICIGNGGAFGGDAAFDRGSEGEAGGSFARIFIRPLFFYVKADARKGRLCDLPCIGEGDDGESFSAPSHST